ncbi:outer membrane protein TolC [Bacteroides zoogleoformans]|uniref:TolC family protein n=1 Tax=Bacteroides zoogleoformans TaxID=28119 RepID=A0ABN5IP24_9BACE|nr:TolC family protein [Bacteroides zoogleoformans]AVM53586.1 TolC family protein [Bacteroides zoogleoformans]TWJ13583.1 outer membrane protein TolC [Bacteroides zoogleoformans]
MNRRNRLPAVGVCLLLASLPLKAQHDAYLSVDDALEMAVRNNKNIRMAELEHKMANADFHQTDAVFLPQLSVGYQAMVTNNPLNAFGFLLQQERVTAQDFDPAKLNHPGITRNYGASVDVQMPLFNPDMIYARQGAKIQKDVYKHKAQYTVDYVKFEVQKAYTRLQFAYQAYGVLKATLSDVERISRSVQNFHEQGLVQKSDVLNAQVQVNTVESALAKAESSISNASDGLKLLLGMQQTESPHAFLTDSLVLKDESGIIASFSPMRSDVLAMQRAVDASDAMVKSSAMKFVPTINAFGSYQFNDTKFLGFDRNSYLAGVSLSWTVFSGNRNASKLRSDIFRRDKLKLELEEYKDKSRMEVNKTARDLQDLKQEIRKHQVSVEQADEALRIMNNRYKEGLVSTTDLLASQAQLSRQKLSLAQAVMAYNIAHYYQELLTTVQ